MAFHVALLEPGTPSGVGALAARCATEDAPLHVVGPLPFAEDDARLRRAGPEAWGDVDWWLHPGWREFRDAMSRERCLYFALDGAREASEAPWRENSVLVLGDEEGGLPDRIREKYPHRIFRLPMPPRKRKVDLARSTELLLAEARAGLVARRTGATVTADKPMRYGRGRGRR